MAFALVPPVYPGSELIKTAHYYGSADAYSEVFIYRTRDDIDKVLVFMEMYMPGFIREQNSIQGEIYKNVVENKSELAQRAADKACTSLICTTYNVKTYPGVGILLSHNPDNSEGTIINVSVDYPTP